MSVAEKQQYSSKAESEVNARRNAKTFSDLRSLNVNSFTDRNLRQRMVSSKVKEMEAHDVWKSGLQISSFNHAIEKEKVSMQPQSVIKEKFQEMFQFDPNLGTKPISRKAEKVCSQLHGGLCSNVPLWKVSDTNLVLG